MPRLKPFYSIKPMEWSFPLSKGDLSASSKSLSPKFKSLESVRQWILRELIETYGYPHEWLGNRILFINGNSTNFPIDSCFGFCINTPNQQDFLWVLVAEPGRISEVEQNLRTILLRSNVASVGIATDGSVKNTLLLRRRFDSEKCDYITDIEVYSKSSFIEAYTKPVKDNSHKLQLLSERVENLFYEAHSHIRDIDGLHPDEALDELCKLIYTKLYDEEITESGYPYLVQQFLYGTADEFAATIRALYIEARDYDTRVFSLKIPNYQRSRGVFNTHIRLSSPALSKIASTLQDYDLTKSTIDVKGRAFQKVLGAATRAGMGQYFTPDPVVRFMVTVASPKVTDLILDPFCGSARFLTTCLDFVKQHSYQASEKSLHEFAFGKLHGIEKSDRMVRIAMTDMRLHGDGHSNIRCTDALLDFSNYPDIQSESFDLILTNPPFGSVLGVDAIAQLGKFELATGRKTVPLEVLGLERCLQLLRPGGRLGIVLPDGLLANRGAKYVRDWFEAKVKVRAIISLPIETFTPFGANIKTSILFARKWGKGERRTLDHPVLLARVDNVGYDASGRFKDGAELEAVANILSDFLREEGW